MRALNTFVAVLVLGASSFALAGGGGCTADDETVATKLPIVPCSPTRVPLNDERCDPNELGEFGYCRPTDCSGQSLDECRCRAGAWVCTKTARSGQGCGTAPKCMDQPCRPDTGGADLCPAAGSSCPSGCSDVTAQRIDATRGCVWPAEVVQCTGPATGCTAGLTCLLRMFDDTPFWFTSDCHREGWRPCTESEKAIAVDGPDCTAVVDAGGDTAAD